MPNTVNNTAYLIDVFFGLMIGVFLIRTMLIAVNASFYSPICQFVYKLTNPVIAPIRRFLPRAGKIETASLTVAFVLALIELALLTFAVGAPFSPVGWLLGAVVTLLSIAVWIAFWALLIRAVLSFFSDERHHPNAQVLAQVTEPIVRPFRRVIPPAGGMDFSFLLASFALVLVRIIVIAPLADLAARV